MRLGLGGGGTDVNPFNEKYGASVLNVTIAKYAHSTITYSDANTSSIISQDRNYILNSDIKELLKVDLSLVDSSVRFQVATLQYFHNEFNHCPKSQIIFSSMCDTYHGSGLGASSSILVSQIKCLSKYFNFVLDDYDLAKTAINIERNICNINGGFQDQYAATFGGFNYMLTEPGTPENVQVHGLKIPNWIKAELTSRMLMLHVDRVSNIDDIFDDIKTASTDSNLLEMKDLTNTLNNQLLKGALDDFTETFNLLWKLKEQTSKKILPETLRSIFDFAFKNGATAGKVSGAGGGGFFVFLCDPTVKGGLMRSLQSMNSRIESVTFDDLGAQSWEI